MFKLKRSTKQVSRRRAAATGRNNHEGGSLGQSRATTYAYHQTGDHDNASKNRESRGIVKSNSLKVKRWVVFTGIVIVFIGALLELRVSTQAKVVILDPAGFTYNAHSLSQYEQISFQAIGDSVYNQLKITISTGDIGKYIETRLPEVASVSVTEPFIGSVPTVYLQLKTPALILDTASGNYIIDSSGQAIALATALAPKQQAKLTLVQDTHESRGNIGQVVLTSENVQFIRLIAAGMQVKKITVTKMVLLPSSEELDVYIANQPYYIKFNLHQNDALQQLGTYLAAITNLNQQHVKPTQYINVMVDGRAFYK